MVRNSALKVLNLNLVLGSITSLTITSALTRCCLLKIFEMKFVRNDFEMENVGDDENVSEILYSQNEADVTNLIKSVDSDNVIFGSSLTKLNNELSGNRYRPKRKELNTVRAPFRTAAIIFYFFLKGRALCQSISIGINVLTET